MNREVSVYLDIVRLAAALIVFVGHVSGERMTGGFLWQVAPYMSQAVTVFFVLSGFVIAYVTERREASARSYAASRLARIYSVALPALALTFVLDGIGRSINPSVYSRAWGFEPTGLAWQFLSGLLFVHEIWFSHVTQGSNLPYWSLGYEVCYYVIFGLSLFTRRWLLWTGLAAAACGPAILAMFPLWLLGVVTYRIIRRSAVAVRTGALLWLGSIAACAAFEVWATRTSAPMGRVPQLLRRPELVQDYVVAALFSLNLIGFSAISGLFARLLRYIAPAAQWAAGLTFALYLFHLPLAQFLSAVSPWPLASWQNRAFLLLGTLLGVVVVGTLAERWKGGLRRLFNKMLAGRAVTPA